MSESEEVNQDCPWVGETQFYFPIQGTFNASGKGSLNVQPQNLSHNQIAGQATGVYYAWQPNSTVPFQQQQFSPQFGYPSMSYCIRPTPNINMLNNQHNIQPSQYLPTQVTQSSKKVSQQTIHSDTSQRSNKNWSNEEDLQLTIAWDRISTDSTIGVGQKRARFWDRVHEMFSELMESKHGLKSERNSGGCENRMNEIKSHCSRWTAVRSRAFTQKHSGWSAQDYEKLCHSMHEKEGKGPFKWEECWIVLKENPKWQDYSNKSSENNSHSTTRTRTVRPSQTTDTSVHQNVSIDLTQGNMETQTPVTPMNALIHVEPEDGNNIQGTCTPNVDGPASIDIERPTGTQKAKKAKASNSRQRKIKQHLQAQSSANQSFTASLMSIQSETNVKWDKMADTKRMRDLKEEERYKEMREIMALEHEMKVASNRSKLAQDRGVLGQKLLDASNCLTKLIHNPCLLVHRR